MGNNILYVLSPLFETDMFPKASASLLKYCQIRKMSITLIVAFVKKMRHFVFCQTNKILNIHFKGMLIQSTLTM